PRSSPFPYPPLFRSPQAVAHQQRHQGQRAAGTGRRGADSELGGHHHTQRPTLAHGPADQQQAQTQGVEVPAEQDHAQHRQQQSGRESAQAFPESAAAQQQGHQRGGQQRAGQQPEAAL